MISVIMPVHNGETFLAEALASIDAQGYAPLEVVLVDDGSTDQTAEIARNHSSVRYNYQPQRGPAAARNLGLQMAKGEWIAFLDCDDLWTEGSLHKLAALLLSSPTVDIVQGQIQELLWDQSSDQFVSASKPYQFINVGSALYRKTVFEQVGGFDETLRFGEDVDWFLRAWSDGIPKQVIERVTLLYRRHPTNMTNGKDVVGLGMVQIYKRHLQRIRQGLPRATPLPGFPTRSSYIGTPQG